MKHVRTFAWESDMFKMSVITSDSWQAQSLRTRPGMLSRPEAFQGLTFYSNHHTTTFVTSSQLIRREGEAGAGGGVGGLKLCEEAIKSIRKRGVAGAFHPFLVID